MASFAARAGLAKSLGCRLEVQLFRQRRTGESVLRLVVWVFFWSGLPCVASGQQTIFNVPTADVLARGSVYFEEDSLWRPQVSRFFTATFRVVVGVAPGVEAGVNVGAFITPGRSDPTAAPNLKWQPFKSEKLAVTAGIFGLFHLRGTEDGGPAMMTYGHLAYSPSSKLRLTGGAWVASSGFARPQSAKGVLVALEQRIDSHVVLAADWFSGKSGIGYFSPGLISTWGKFTLYAAYSMKNADSKGSALLFEFGWAL